MLLLLHFASFSATAYRSKLFHTTILDCSCFYKDADIVLF